MRILSVVMLCCCVFIGSCSNFKSNNLSAEFDDENNEIDIDNRYVLDLDEIDEFDIPKLRLSKNLLVKQAEYELNENRNYLKALTLFNKIVSFCDINSSDSQIFFEIGKINLSLENIDEAIENFTKAIELENKAVYYEARAEAYNLIGDSKLAAEDKIVAEKLQ